MKGFKNKDLKKDRNVGIFMLFVEEADNCGEI